MVVSMLTAAILATSLFYLSSMSTTVVDKSHKPTSGNDQVSIYHLAPEIRGGEAYKLVYLVHVPMDVYWKFKTDFDNDFLVTNKYIRGHKFISRSGNTVVTEDKYTHVPGVIFRWKTEVFSEIHRLDFVLINPNQCGQKYHYGHIQIEPVKEGTRVTQLAYFDFWGASLWANYPWGGGMNDFLLYTAHWEQETVLKLRYRYYDEKSK